MSENTFLYENTYGEYPGFRSALFFNLPKFDISCSSPKNKKNNESSNMSIESTPTKNNKAGGDSAFKEDIKFCLSSDLLEHLEDSPPTKVGKRGEHFSSSGSLIN